MVLVGNLAFVSPMLPLDSQVLASRGMSLDNRQSDRYVNQVFKDNILLTMAYLRGDVGSAKDISWPEIERPFIYKLSLRPNDTFAFHQDVLSTYSGKVVLTNRARFNAQDGFKTDGYLYGDGVCHLASIINWAAKDAGLDVSAPTRHDFAAIPDVPKEYGVSIYNNPSVRGSNTQQNLYITNNTLNTVSFVFDYKDSNLTVSVIKDN